MISNGIGGYANSTVIGSNSRSFSSLLNVSLNHPTDRYTLLANISERISDDTGITNLATYHSISETYEGFRYLSHFSFGSYPEYTYQIGDMIIRKSIGMVYGKNTSVICYSVKTAATTGNCISHHILHVRHWVKLPTLWRSVYIPLKSPVQLPSQAM